MTVESLKAYELIQKEQIPDLRSTGYLLRHKKTGARVALLSNDDENKVFNIGFRTPPSDSTGVPHIMEHSVLCGSTDFPVKDPFVELVKGSLNTFLNAMTYPDKTVFMDSPISPSIFQDFLKLCSKKVDESIKEEIKNGASLYNSKNLVATVEKALRRGIIANSNAENTTILAHRAGTMFVAYCEKTDKGSYRVRSFFPVLHGSHMHKDIMKEYLKNKGKICLSDIPKLIGLKNLVPKEFYYNYLGSLCEKSIFLETMFLSQLQFMQLRKQKNVAK